MKFNMTVTVIVVLYLLVMLFIGWWSSKRITSNTDFMVAGRRLGPFLMAGTLAWSSRACRTTAFPLPGTSSPWASPS